MKEYKLPYFGQLPMANLEEYYEVKINCNGSKIKVDLNFNNKTIDAESLDKVKHFIENIEQFDTQNQSYLLENYNNTSDEDDTVQFYLEHHLEECDADDLATIINFNDTAISPEKQLFAKLKIKRVGLYPDSEDNFAIFDYTIGEEVTNYLLVIYTDSKGTLELITEES